VRRLRSFKPQEVAVLFQQGKRIMRNPIFDLLIAPKALEQARLLVITSKKVGSAPARNKIRRQLKAVFHEADLANGGYDTIVIVKRTDIGVTFQELRDLLLKGIAKAG
jgi:ribonuclease P protein component